MKRKVIVCLKFMLVLAANTFAAEIPFIVAKDVKVADGCIIPRYCIDVKKDSEIVVNTKNTMFFPKDGKCFIEALYNGDYYYFPEESIVQENVVKSLPNEFKNCNWGMGYYCEMLNNKELKIRTDYEPYWRPENQYIYLENDRYEWYYLFDPLYIVLYNHFFWEEINLLIL